MNFKYSPIWHSVWFILNTYPYSRTSRVKALRFYLWINSLFQRKKSYRRIYLQTYRVYPDKLKKGSKCWLNLPSRFWKAGRVWCGDARETHWATCHNEVTPSKTKEQNQISLLFQILIVLIARIGIRRSLKFKRALRGERHGVFSVSFSNPWLHSINLSYSSDLENFQNSSLLHKHLCRCFPWDWE